MPSSVAHSEPPIYNTDKTGTEKKLWYAIYQQYNTGKIHLHPVYCTTATADTLPASFLAVQLYTPSECGFIVIEDVVFSLRIPDASIISQVMLGGGLPLAMH